MQRQATGFLISAFALSACALIFAHAETASDATQADPILSGDIPADVAPADQPTQADLDRHAWRLFVAMNWPTADGRPSPDAIGTDPGALRVWETFVDPTTILDLRKGIARREPETPQGRRALNADFFLQNGSNLPVVDGTRNFLVNEFVIDPTIVDFTLSNGLTSTAGFEEYAKTHKELLLPNGSIEVKASWRILPDGAPAAIRNRYYLRDATISVATKQSASGKPFTMDAIVGLVGFHVIQKTPNHPNWIWATFEHVDLYEGSDPVFKVGTEGSLESNRAPPLASTGEPAKTYLWRDPMDGHPTAADYEPPAIARSPNELPFPDKTNAAWQAALPAPWSNYRLVVTQWTDASGQPRPQNADGVSIAKNSTMETFLLGDQTISRQVPGTDTTDACPKPNDGSTLWAEIDQILQYHGYPKTGRTVTTWSSCLMCHQLALYKYGKDDEDVIQTDYSFAYKSVLPVIPCSKGSF